MGTVNTNLNPFVPQGSKGLLRLALSLELESRLRRDVEANELEKARRKKRKKSTEPMNDNR